MGDIEDIILIVGGLILLGGGLTLLPPPGDSEPHQEPPSIEPTPKAGTGLAAVGPLKGVRR